MTHRHVSLTRALLAAVLALGLAACGEESPDSPGAAEQTETTPASPTPTPTPTPTPSQTPSGGAAEPAASVRLDADLPEGPAPRIAYQEGRTLHLPDGGTRTLPHAYDRLALVGDMVAGSRNGVIELTQGDDTSEHPLSDGFVQSITGGTIAWDQPDGTLQTAWDGGSVEMRSGLEDATVTAAQGDGSCYEMEGGCILFYSPGGDLARFTDSHGQDDTIDRRVLHVGDASSAGDLAVQTSVSDEGSCWGVLGRGRKLRWKSCEHSLFSFSPDGQRVLAGPAYLDGLGFGRIAMLDGATGAEVAAFQVEDGYIAGGTWEDDSTALLTIHLDQGGWRVIRASADGTAETSLAWDGEDRDELERPWTMAMRPS